MAKKSANTSATAPDQAQLAPHPGFVGKWMDNDRNSIQITIKENTLYIEFEDREQEEIYGPGEIKDNDPEKVEVSFPWGYSTLELITPNEEILFIGPGGDEYKWLNFQLATSTKEDESLLSSLKTGNTPEIRLNAAKEIHEKIKQGGLKDQSRDEFFHALSQNLNTEYDEDVRKEVEEAYELINKGKNEGKNFHRKNLKIDDDAKQTDTINHLLEIEEAWGLRILVEEWVNWIASGDLSKGDLIDYAAEKMRETPRAVLPLVLQLEHDVHYVAPPVISKQPSPETETTSSSDKEIESLKQPVLNVKASKESMDWLKEQVINELKRLELTPDPTRVDQLAKLKLDNLGPNGRESLENFVKNSRAQNSGEGQLREEIQALIEVEVKDRQLKVHRRIARLLANMSDSATFKKENSKAYDKIIENLEKHAVRKLGPRLSKETDPEIRNHLATMLGNVGGSQAIDALARAVVGQEQTRANRQKLLAQYYLDPSREQSKQASNILEGAVSQAKRTLWLLQGLNVIVFMVGMLILLVGLYVTFFTEDNGRVAGALASVGGLAGIITILIKNPLNRIQNAMAKLVQLETAFTSFIWELNLNSTYIQSQYVAEGVLTASDVSQTINRIEEAMNLTMSQVATYTEEGGQLFIPHLKKITPVVGKFGEPLSVYGVNLKRETGEKNNGVNILTLSINHVPVLTKDISREKEEFKLTLPAKENLPGDIKIENGSIWISLVVDGLETNALPFRVIEDKQ